MKAIDLIRTALAMGDQFTLPLIEDMRAAPLTAPTPRGGNHPLWVIGHLVYTESALTQALLGEEDSAPEYAQRFAFGMEPSHDATEGPTIDEALAVYRRLRARNLALLEKFGDDRLDEPVKSPPAGLEEIFTTVGRSYLSIALHQWNHRGQVADARRAAGRRPLFEPSDAAVA